MKNPQGVIKRWTVFVGIFAAIVSICAIVFLSKIGTPDWSVEELVPQFAIGLTLVSVMLWASVINSIKKNPKLAGTFAIIGGVICLPIGVLLIIAGIRLRAAAPPPADGLFGH
jgi:drug/metabolite transporter (DMT)-like permease